MDNDLKKRNIPAGAGYVFGFIMAVAIVIIVLVVGLNSAKIRRRIKTMQSGFNNGIDRTITLYDYNGNEIRTWTGTFDVTKSETGIMFDDQEGKRTIITNGIIVNQEN